MEKSLYIDICDNFIWKVKSAFFLVNKFSVELFMEAQSQKWQKIREEIKMDSKMSSDQDYARFEQSYENKALAVGNDKKALCKRLNDTKSVLADSFVPFFRSSKFDFKNKRLIGTNGYYLQWKLRPMPDKPISYNNWQTTRGTVSLEHDE